MGLYPLLIKDVAFGIILMILVVGSTVAIFSMVIFGDREITMVDEDSLSVIFPMLSIMTGGCTARKTISCSAASPGEETGSRSGKSFRSALMVPGSGSNTLTDSRFSALFLIAWRRIRVILPPPIKPRCCVFIILFFLGVITYHK